MSRTYRRRGAEADHASYFEKHGRMSYFTNEWIDWHQDNYPELSLERAERKHRAIFYSDRYRTMTTPMWWYHETSTVPQRREERDLLAKVLNMKHLDEIEAVIFPEGRRPQNYYW